MSYVNVKLPSNTVIITLPKITTTQQTNPGNYRVTRAGNYRFTRAGNQRVTRSTISSYPELVAVRIPNGVISVPIPN